jgi:hypothetical protein
MAKTTDTSNQSWREYLDSEEATRVIYLIFGFLAITMVMVFLQTRTEAICCGDWDGYYHIRWSALLWESFSSGRWLPSFEWLPLTVLNPQDYADHHFLFHLLQIPFLWFFEPVTAAKVAAVVFSSLAISSVYWLLWRYEVKHQLLWLLGILTCANAFYYRMNMAKAPPLTIIITVFGIHLLFQRKYVWLAPLMFAFVWTYSLFPLLLFAAVIWAAIVSWNERIFEWRPVVYTFGGMVAGNIINPYFPQNFGLFWEHLVTKFKVGEDFAVAVGGEWYPYTGMELLTDFPIAMVAMLVGYILFMPKGLRLPERATFFLGFVTILLAAQFRSKRFAEYFPPFAILFCAFSWQAFMARFAEDNPPAATVGTRWRIAKNVTLWGIGVALTALFLFTLTGFHKFGFNITGVAENIASNEAADKYRRAMEFATGRNDRGDANIPDGEIIFNCTWDDFPKLFFYNTKHRYVYGLDPNYLYTASPERYTALKDLTEGKVDDPAPVIREKFGANYIFADAAENTDMIAAALDSGWAEVIYEDNEARILRIRREKGEPVLPKADDAPESDAERQVLDELERNDAASEEGNDESEQ